MGFSNMGFSNIDFSNIDFSNMDFSNIDFSNIICDPAPPKTKIPSPYVTTVTQNGVKPSPFLSSLQLTPPFHFTFVIASDYQKP